MTNNFTGDLTKHSVSGSDVTRVDTMLKPQILSSKPLPQEVNIHHRQDITRVDRVREEPSSSFSTMKARDLTDNDQEMMSMRQNPSMVPAVDHTFDVNVQKDNTTYPINEERTIVTHTNAPTFETNNQIKPEFEEISRIEQASFARTQGSELHEHTMRPILTPSKGSSGTMHIYRPSPSRSYTSQPDPRMDIRSNSVTSEKERATPVRFGMGDGGSTRVTPTVQYSSRRETPSIS